MLNLFHQDYHSITLVEPGLDLQQDWMLTYAKEENGKTTLQFYRDRNTTDQQNDTAIQVTKFDQSQILVISSGKSWGVTQQSFIQGGPPEVQTPNFLHKVVLLSYAYSRHTKSIFYKKDAYMNRLLGAFVRQFSIPFLYFIS